ncbi:MAG: hypothetical protein WCK31_02945 [bacterium]
MFEKISFPIPENNRMPSDVMFSASPDQLVNRFLVNRIKLKNGLCQLSGLSFSLCKTTSISIGPADFVSPIPTLFRSPEEAIESAKRDKAIADLLQKETGVICRRNYLNALAFNATPRSDCQPYGGISMDSIVFPPNPLAVREFGGNPRDKQVFSLFGNEEDVNNASEKAWIDVKMNPLVVLGLSFVIDDLIKTKVISSKVGETIRTDLNLALNRTQKVITREDGNKVFYTDFVRNLNGIIAGRLQKIYPDYPGDLEYIDLTKYVPFLRGLSNPQLFLTNLADLGVIKVGDKVLKYAKPDGSMENLFFSRFTPKGITLRRNNQEITIDDALKIPTIVPTKPIAYFLLMSGIVDIGGYADDSSIIEHLYNPYMETLKQLSDADLMPVAYPYKPRREQCDILTLPEWYALLLKEKN